MTSKAFEYAKKIHPDLPRRIVLTPWTSEALQACRPDLEDDLGKITGELSELLAEDGCSCQFLLRSGVTLNDLAAELQLCQDRLIQLEAERATPRLPSEIMELLRLLGGAPVDESDELVKLNEKIMYLLTAMDHMVRAVVCRRKSRAAALPRPNPYQNAQNAQNPDAQGG